MPHARLDEAEALQMLLVDDAEDDGEFMRLRQIAFAEAALEAYAPKLLKASRNLGQFWQFTKAKNGTDAERRTYLWVFAPK